MIRMSRIGCASLGDRVPDADRLEQPPRRRHDRGGARIGAGAPERRIGHRHREGGAQRLPQRDRERQAGKAGAADQDVERLRLSGIGHTTAVRTRNHSCNV